MRIRCAGDAIENGIYLIPEDRRKSGLVTDMTFRENITLPDLNSYTTLGLIQRKRETGVAEKQCEKLKIKLTSVETLVKNLSGGNQQKVVLAKWLALKPKVVIFDEPTRGIDVGSKAEIYHLMRELADNGVVIVMISSDMEEILGVSDRIAVMHEGQITGILTRDKFEEEAVMRLAVGQTSRAGNIGNPFCAEVAKISGEDYVCLEVSSFQLERIKGFKPKIAVILNFSRNHLDRHKDMQEYLEVKKRIFLNQDKNDFLVLNGNDPMLKGLAKEANSKVAYFYEGSDLNPNQAAVTAVAAILGIEINLCLEVFREFRGL